jgi:excisionase family DNA binding protein
VRDDTPPAKWLYRFDEAAPALGIGRSKLFQLVKTGRLKAVSIDGRRLIHRDELEKFAAVLADDDAEQESA